MQPQFDGFYLSGRLRSEDWHAGVCWVREYVRYLKLFEDGRWLLRDHPAPDLNFPAYLAGVTEQDFRNGWAGHDPLDREYDFIHQTGQFSQVGDGLLSVFRHGLVGLNELGWEVRVESAEGLVSG